MSAYPAPVLVTGATGRQGGATARALLAAGVRVRALVRDPATDRAQAVAALGAELVTGDPHDRHDQVRAAGFRRWTLLKPVFSMENFLPSMAYLFPRGIEGGLVTLLRPHTPIPLVAVDDIGRAAAAAIAEPERFDGAELELASDHLPMTEVAEVLSRVLGRQLSGPDVTEEEAFAAGMPAMGASHEWLNAAGQPGSPQFARDLGILLTSYEEWAHQHMRDPNGHGSGFPANGTKRSGVRHV